jgi:hypothetical protein
MGYKLEPQGGDAWKIVFFEEPSYIHSLTMAPEAIEPELLVGVWLVVVFPIWSGPVRASVTAAMSCAKDYEGKFQLGVRPFEAHEELLRWWPTGSPPGPDKMVVAVKDEKGQRELHLSMDLSYSPKWLVLRDGRIVYEGGGLRSQEQLSELMKTMLA